MNLFETLQELKKIQPDQTFSENSRRMILISAQKNVFLTRRIFTIRCGRRIVVMAGALIFIITGGLSTTDLTPQFSSIDPAALRAEAQAIDTQINLLNVSYTETTASTEPIVLA